MKIEEAIKQRKFRGPYEKAVVNLLFTSNIFRDEMRNICKQFDISESHYNVLRILRGRYPNPCSAGEIKNVMLDKNPDLTRLIDKLVQMGLVERSLCDTNRRKMDILITEKGLALLLEMEPLLNDFSDNHRKFLSAEEAEQLSDLLDKLRG